jgi:hypothetical protein
VYLSVVIPVKDERANVRPLVDKLRDALDLAPAWEAVFVDDGSTDGTFFELADLAFDDPRIKVVRLRRTFGQSAALQAGFDHATGAVIVTMDGDLQNDPADIPRMVDLIDDGYDVVLGERAERHDGYWLRTLPSRCGNWLIRRVTGVPYRDFGCTLRAMRREVVADMTLYGEMHRFITAFAARDGGRVTQVPVAHRPRTAGASKYGLGRAPRVALDLLTVAFLSRFQTRPMHLFGGIGLGLLGLGGLSLAATVAMKFNGCDMTGNPLLLLAAMLELMGVQFLSLGLMGEVQARVYFESQGKPAYAVRDTRNVAAPQEQPVRRSDREVRGGRRCAETTA